MEELKETKGVNAVAAETEGAKTGVKRDGFFRRNRGVFGFIVIILLFGIMFFQNGEMIKDMKKILNDSDNEIHEIYDDTKVIEAYKNDSKEGLDEEEAFLFDTLKETIPQITNDGMSVYEKEKAAYDWVFNLTHFDEESLNPLNGGTNEECYKPYDVIKNHKAICVGNATTFKLMMDALDIPCKIVHSTESGEHAWDVVQLDDEWYHVDVTFDGGYSKPNYSNFNVPDSMKDDGSWPYDHNEIPRCNGTKYCYIFMNAEEVKDMYSIPEAIAKARDSGERIVAVTLKNSKGMTRTIGEYIANSMLVNNGEVSFNGYYAVGGKGILVYEIADWSEGNGEVSSEVMEKFAPIFEKVNEGISSDMNGY